ncbi:hypothetical protein SBOR_1477 [Sclerotinia borealis F-4128]|uniref:2EXR domain-containing protein n=1 Tax=Sclerotinia borealis (strain F-4128) TaxID=1432307 RepID=W9CPV6_SCLBF|nr:hypothetical protein SBOR_1477 [Sclerotinia borealis F-4128]
MEEPPNLSIHDRHTQDTQTAEAQATSSSASPYISTQISSQRLGLDSAIPGSFDSTLGRRLLPGGTQSMSRFNTFTKFPQLPREIQRMVWRETLPGPKILLIKPILRNGIPRPRTTPGDTPPIILPPQTYIRYKSNYSMPSTILASKEALDVVSKQTLPIRKSFIRNHIPRQPFRKKILLEIKSDTVYIELEDLAYLCNAPLPRRILGDLWPWMDFEEKGMVNLALVPPCNSRSRMLLTYVGGIIHILPCVRHLTFIIADETQNLLPAERDLAFEDPIDVDYALDLFAKDPREVACEDLPKHHHVREEEDIKFDMAELKKIRLKNADQFRRPFIIPEDLVIDFKIVILREKAEELARRKKRFYALKKLINKGLDVPSQGVSH